MNVALIHAPGRPAAEIVVEEREDDPVEMVNLREKDTGVPGTVYVSTLQGRHGPRIKWYPGLAGAAEAFLTITLEQPQRILNHGVPAREATGALAAAEWAERNREALLHFWSNGTSFDIDELNAFLHGLHRLR
jgi:hypothetical protein